MLHLMIETLLQAYPLYFISVPIIVLIIMFKNIINNRHKREKIFCENIMIVIIGLTTNIIIAATCYSPEFLTYFDISNLTNFRLINFNPESFLNNIVIPSLMGNFHAIVNLFGNILLFVPIGFCGMWLGHRCDKIIFKLVSMSFLFSLLIELTQMSYGRLVDLIDILLNTSGCLLGCGLFMYFMAMSNNLNGKLYSE